jgi:hypothetical protein
MKTNFLNIRTIALGFAMLANIALISAQVEKLPITFSTYHVNPSCDGMNDGSITVDIFGGFPPYFFNGIQITGNQATMDNLSVGTYSFFISDTSLASNSGEVTLTSPAAPQVTAVIGNVSSPGGNDGFVDLTVVSSLPVSYNWTTLEPITLQQNNEDQFNLTAGIYDVMITQSNGCQFPKRITVLSLATVFEPIIDYADAESTVNAPDMIEVYPNPSHGVVHIKSKVELKEYTVISETGMIIERGNSIAQLENMRLKTGQYVITMTDVKGNTSLQILKVL